MLHTTLWVVGAIVLWLAISSRKTDRHQKNWGRAKKTYRKLKKIPLRGQRLNYLRKINPFVFEELILFALAKRGHKIKRNPRYTGDGGIDGQAWINGQHFLIQAKRYKSSINPQDVSAFAELLSKNPKSKGLFVHTGRTGNLSKHYARYQEIQFISGDSLLGLLD